MFTLSVASFSEPLSAWGGSVIYGRISKPRKEHAVTNQFRREVVHGYSVCASVNAKNSYGGYTGQKQRWFLIRKSQIIRTNETKFGEIYIGHRINCEDGPPSNAIN